MMHARSLCRFAGAARSLWLLGLVALVAAFPAVAERPRVYALTGATVHIAPGNVLEEATVVLRDGRIEAVGADLDLPADAVAIDASGHHIYAGLIDIHSKLGAASDAAPGGRGPGGPGGATPARSGPVHPLSVIRAEDRVVDSLLPFSGDRAREMEKLRDNGFGAVLSVPASGLLGGVSAAILLVEELPVADLILNEAVAQHGGLERGGFGGGYPGSLMGIAAALRQEFHDAGRFLEWQERYAADPTGVKRPPFHASHAALAPVLSGEQQLFLRAAVPADVLLADRIAREFDLDLVVVASGNEYENAERIAATGRTLILPLTFPDKPDVDDEDEALGVDMETMRRYLDAARGPAVLHEAGVGFAFTADGLGNSKDFYKNLRKIVEDGLPAEVALAALTTHPAELVGLADVLGTLEAGKIANLLVADGPLFAEKTNIRHVFVDGRQHEIEVKEKPKGDPNAVVDPRGEWSVTFDMGGRKFERVWTIEGDKENYRGTAETRSGTVEFDEVVLEGNALTVTMPARGGQSATEITVIIQGNEFSGVTEMGPRSVELKGTRDSAPEGGAR